MIRKHTWNLLALVSCAFLGIRSEGELPQAAQDLAMFDDPALENKITRQAPDSAKSCLEALEAVKPNRILQYNLYTYTYPPAQRELFTYPSLMQYTPKKSLFGVNIIYQQTTNLFPFCNGIAGYLNVLSSGFLQAIDNAVVRELFNINAPEIVQLATNAFAEQRRVGFLFDFFKRTHRWCFGLEVPLYAVERNYNLPLEDQQEIKSYYFFEGTDAPNEKAEQAAYLRHVLDSRLGLGDTRLTIGAFLTEKDRCDMVFGAKIVMPTAATIASGFIGSDFRKLVNPQNLSLCEIINDAMNGGTAGKQKALALALAYAEQASYQAGAIMLPTDLGQAHRWQAGLYLEPYLRLNDNLDLSAYFRVNWIFPKTVSRFVNDCINPSDFEDSNFNPSGKTEQQCAAAVSFLENRLKDVVFPPTFAIRLKSQFEAQITIGPWINFDDNWRMFVGYDYWYQKRESYNTACMCEPRDFAPCGRQIVNALVPRLEENKLVFKCCYKKYKATHNVLFDFGGDFPLVCHGIGPTYTGFMKVTWEF